MKKFILPILVIFSAISCNPIGDTIAESEAINPEFVNTFDNLKLKKGDILEIWGIADTDTANYPQVEMHYVLTENERVIKNEKFYFFNGQFANIINSTYSSEKEEIEEEEEDVKSELESNDPFSSERNSEEISGEKKKPEPSEIVSWSFEKKAAEIPIAKDGVYTLDFKIDDSHLATFEKVGIIIRKK